MYTYIYIHSYTHIYTQIYTDPSAQSNYRQHARARGGRGGGAHEILRVGGRAGRGEGGDDEIIAAQVFAHLFI